MNSGLKGKSNELFTFIGSAHMVDFLAFMLCVIVGFLLCIVYTGWRLKRHTYVINKEISGAVYIRMTNENHREVRVVNPKSIVDIIWIYIIDFKGMFKKSDDSYIKFHSNNLERIRSSFFFFLIVLLCLKLWVYIRFINI